MEEQNISNKISGVLLNANDNLNLPNLDVNSIPSDIIFPDELSQYLQGQIQFLLHAKGMLERQLNENEDAMKLQSKKISKLTAKITEYEQFTKPSEGIISNNPIHLMSAKIVELSKKLRDRTVEIESLKTKYSKAQQKITYLETAKKDVVIPNNENVEIEDTSIKKNQNEEIRTLQEKLSQTTNKLFDVKNKNIELKNEIKVANKLLQQEVGEHFTSVQNFVQNQTSWRGRAQQIINLQQKNSELQDRIASLSINIESNTTLPSKPDTKKHIIAQLEKDLDCVKLELDEAKKKIIIGRSRIKMLENENTNMKMKFKSLNSKSENDEKFVQCLQSQISSLEQINSEMGREKQGVCKKLEEEIKSLKSQIERDNVVIENLQTNLEDKNNRIKEMQSDNMFTKRTNSAKLNNDSRVSSPCTPKTDPNKLQVLEVERKRLLELVEVLNERLKKEREAHSTTQINYKKERQKAAKLETKLSRAELENTLNSSYANSYSKSQSKLNSPHSNLDVGDKLSNETLKNSLELAEEHISMLKSKLDLVQKEKDLDFQKFSQILSDTSTVLLKYNTPESITPTNL